MFIAQIKASHPSSSALWLVPGSPLRGVLLISSATARGATISKVQSDERKPNANVRGHCKKKKKKPVGLGQANILNVITISNGGEGGGGGWAKEEVREELSSVKGSVSSSGLMPVWRKSASFVWDVNARGNLRT